MFEELIEAIDKLTHHLDKENNKYYDESNVVIFVPVDQLEDLRKVANTYFVEPEEDKEFNDWKNTAE